MKKLARFLALALALVMMLSVLAACGGNAPSAATPSASSQAPAEKEVTIDFWTHYTDDVTFTKKKVEDFNKEYAGKIKVNFKHVTDDYNNVLLLALKNGTGPDLFADGIPLDQLIQQNYVAPIEDLMSPEMMERVKDKKMINNNWVDGHWYSLPFRGYNFRLAWNKELFKAAGLDPEAPPKNYDEVIAFAKKITEYGKTQNPPKYGFMLPTGEDWIWWIYGQQMSYVNGESYYDYNTGTYQWEALKKVMELWLKLKEDGSLFPGGTTMQNDPARAQFSAGNVGMIVAASWDIGVFNDQFPAVMEWDVAPLPSFDGQRHGYSQFDAGSYLQINAASKNKEAAMKFFEYLLSEDTLVEYYEGGYGVPVYDGIAEKASKVPDRPGFAGFADVSVDRMYPYETPVQVEGVGFGTMMNNIMNGAIGMDEAFADLNKRYNEAVKKGVADGDFKLEDYMVKNYSPMNPSGK